MLQKHFFLGILLIQAAIVSSQTIEKQQSQALPVVAAPSLPKDHSTLQHAPLTIPLTSAPAQPAAPASASQPKQVPARSAPLPAAPASPPQAHPHSGQPQQPSQQLPKKPTLAGTTRMINSHNNNHLNGPLFYGAPGSKLMQSLLNQYNNGQFAVGKPSANNVRPSGSINSFINSITSSLRLPSFSSSAAANRRSGKGSPLDNALYSLNAIPDSTGGAGNGEFNLNNINAINEMISTALNTLNANGGPNGMNMQNMPGNAVNSGLMSTVGSFLSSNIAKPSKKLLFDLPKAFYKSIGEKISGAGEAAVSATVPIKDSFFSTIKSFYSYLKPSRSSAEAMAAAAAAGFSGQGDMNGANGASGVGGNGNGGVFNFKRRQSMESPYVYHFAAAQPSTGNGNNNQFFNHQQQQPQMFNNGNQQQRPQQHQQVNWQQPQNSQQPQQWNGNSNFVNNFPKQQQAQAPSNTGNTQQFLHQQAVEQYNHRQPQTAVHQNFLNNQQTQFDQAATSTQQFGQALQQLYNMADQHSSSSNSKAIPYGTRMQPLESQQIPAVLNFQQQQQHQNQHSGLFTRSKELFNKIARKAAPRTTLPPQMAQFPGQFLGNPAAANQQLSSQILNKVQSKLGTLPAAYNQQQQQQVQNQPQQSSTGLQSASPSQQASGQPQQGQMWTQSVVLSNPPSQPGQQSQWTQTQQQQQQTQNQQPSSISNYFTQNPSSNQQQQPSSQFFGNQGFQSDQGTQQQSSQQQLGQYIGQLAGTSSTSTPSSVSTSVSISKSISSSSSSDASGVHGDQPMDHDQGMMQSDQASMSDGPLYYFESGPGTGAGHQEGHLSEDNSQHQSTDNNK